MTTTQQSLEDSEGRAARDYIAELARLADQAAFDGLHGLQDACLVLMESLGASSPGEMVTSKAGLSAIVNAWPLLVRAYRQAPRAATGKIMEFLRHPDLQLPLSDEEFAIIEAGLLAEDGIRVADATGPGDAELSAEGFREEVDIAELIGDDSTVVEATTEADFAETEWLAGDIGKEVGEPDAMDLEDAGVPAERFREEVDIAELIGADPAAVESTTGADSAGTEWLVGYADEEMDEPDAMDQENAGVPIVSAWEDGEIVEATTGADFTAAEWLLGGIGEETDEPDAVGLEDAGIPAENAWEDGEIVELIDDDLTAATTVTGADSIAAEWLAGEEMDPPDSIGSQDDAEVPAVDSWEAVEAVDAVELSGGESAAVAVAADSTAGIVQDHIAELERLADQAAFDGFYGLQDACLLLMELVNALPQEKSAAAAARLSAMLGTWGALVQAYRQAPQAVIGEIIAFLRHPDLQLPLSDEEFAMIAENLLAKDADGGAGVPDAVGPGDAASWMDADIVELIGGDAAVVEATTEADFMAAEWLADDIGREVNELASTEPGDDADVPAISAWEDVEIVELEADDLPAVETTTEADFAPAEWLAENADGEADEPDAVRPEDTGISAVSAWEDGEIVESIDDDLTAAMTATGADFTAAEWLAGDEADEPDSIGPPQDDVDVPAVDSWEALEAVDTIELGGESVVVAVAAETSPAAESRIVRDRIAELERLADQAAFDGFYGLQDACLLLMESLNALPQGESATASAHLSAMLDTWSTLVQAYRQAPQAVAGEIIAFLRHPDLQLPLSDEEFAMIAENLLVKEADGGADVPNAAGLGDADVPATGSWEAADAALPGDAADEVHAPLPKAVRELVELLLIAAELIGAPLQEISADDPATVVEGLQQVEDELERFARAAETAGFEGLAQMCEHVGVNVRQLYTGKVPFSVEKLALLRAWLAQVKAYLPRCGESRASQILVAQLSDRNWPSPLSPEASAAILARMQASDMLVGTQEEPARAQAATAEDVSLALPEDVNRELLEVLLQELPTYTQQFSEAVQRLQAGGGFQEIEIAQRVAHTLKGSANTVGIRGIAVLTHHLEDILLLCAKEHKIPGAALVNALIDAADCLENMSEALLGLGEAPADARTVLQEILDWANRIDREGIPEEDEHAPALPQAASADPSETGTAESADHPASPPAQQAQTAMVRVPTDQIENLFRLSGESIILNGQAQERLRRIKNQLQNMEAQFALLQQLGAELEELVDIKDLTGRTLNRDNQGFDALEMDQYNELHTASRRMVEATVDAREVSLDIRKELAHMDEVLEYQQHLVIDTQEGVMQTRLVPIVSIMPRLQRGLRQTCRLTGKQADLALSGGNLPIDGDTLNDLVDPLMHVLRNAVDHGIESAEERLALGKPRIGRIAFDFEREGNSIVVRCRDDGHGLDFAAIRAAAERRGLLNPGQEVSEAELERFILRPNFSTRTQSTQTSGRGVGMDAVHVRIVAMGGTLALRSTPGQGMTVELRVPLPLSRSHALLAYAGHHRVAIANKGLAQIFYSGDGELKDLGQEQVLLLGDKLYPVVTLKGLLHVAEHRHEPRPHGAVLLVQNNDKLTAVLVDTITDSRDVVIKSFGAYIPKIPGFIGATILGDGTVTPVLDIPELLRVSVPGALAAYAAPVEMAEAASDLPTVLVVDDSLSQRRALEQLLADAGYRVRTAHDGLEAAEMLAQFKPDIVLTDLEMPRMNGIELASHIRAQAATRHLPVLMITSRTTQKHRQMAEQAGVDGYFTKPVKDEDLLAAMHGLLDAAQSRVHEGRA